MYKLKSAVYHDQSVSVQASDEFWLNVFTSLHQTKNSCKAFIFKESKKPVSSELVQGNQPDSNQSWMR